jgi:hypothetical protein
MEYRPLIARRRRRRRDFIESYTFPLALREKLRERFEDEHTVELALDGLRSWYLACLSADGEMLGMPSRAVDVAWHEMILMTRAYHAFCDRAFGRYLHHSPDALGDAPMEDMLARTLDVVERHSTPAHGGVPLLFAVDAQARLDDGFVWAEEDMARMRRRRSGGVGSSFYPYAAGCGGGGGDGAFSGGCGGGCGGSG